MRLVTRAALGTVVLASLACGGEGSPCVVELGDGGCIVIEPVSELAGWTPAGLDAVPEDGPVVLRKKADGVWLRELSAGGFGQPQQVETPERTAGYGNLGGDWIAVAKGGVLNLATGGELLVPVARSEVWQVGSTLVREDEPCGRWTRRSSAKVDVLEGSVAVSGPTVVGLESGTIALLSGQDCADSGGAANPATYLLRPGGSTPTPAKPLAIERWQPSVTPIPGDRVFVLGGDPDLVGGQRRPDPELWSPVEGGKVLTVPEALRGRLEADVSVLAGRFVVVAGGTSLETREPVADLWLYDVDDNAWHPLGVLQDAAAQLMPLGDDVLIFEGTVGEQQARVRRIGLGER